MTNTIDKLLKELKSEYEPSGDEYKAHVMKLPKWFIVKLLTEVQKERDELLEENNRLTKNYQKL